MKNQDNIKALLKFLPKSQAHCFIQGFLGEEQGYFKVLTEKLLDIIRKAPIIYETHGLGDEIKPVLHYFYGNIDIYIVEIEKRESNEHFGYTSLGLGYLEAGYINLDYIFQEYPLINLDFNFEPKTIREYRQIHQ